MKTEGFIWSALSKEEFVSFVCRAFYENCWKQTDDNYDKYRFSSDGVDRSAFDIGWHVDNLAFFILHASEFYEAFRLFSDEVSCSLYIKLILYRLLGHRHLRIRDNECASAEQAGIQALEKHAVGESKLKVGELFGGLKFFHGIDFMNRQFDIDCWTGSIFYTFIRKQYFLDRNGVRVAPESRDVVIDGGACFGDNALAFSAAACEGYVHSFEPLPSYRAVCQKNIEQNGLDGLISLWPYALSAKTGNLQSLITDDGGGSPAFSVVGNEARLPTMAIDDFVDVQHLGRIDFIKMDIEGAELDALKGAARSIEFFRPKLAISLYHNFTDFFEIPIYLASVYPFYEFFLDHYTIHAGETVLYARPSGRDGL